MKEGFSEEEVFMLEERRVADTEEGRKWKTAFQLVWRLGWERAGSLGGIGSPLWLEE